MLKNYMKRESMQAETSHIKYRFSQKSFSNVTTPSDIVVDSTTKLVTRFMNIANFT